MAGNRSFAGFIGLLAMGVAAVVQGAGMYHGPPGPSPIPGLDAPAGVPFQFGLGLTAFQEKCAACHGSWAEGTSDKGPPLVHPYYEPNHHPDAAFRRAALQGVVQHHWSFGDMPPVASVTEQEVAGLIRFLRWWQKENGIQ